MAWRVAVSVGLLAVVVWLCDWRLILTKFSMLSPGFVVFAWLYYGACQWLSACRWKVLLHAQGVDAPISRLFALYMIGMFANSFLPSGLGGDAVKAYSLYKQGESGTVTVASVVVERFCGMLALAALGIVPAVLLLLEWRVPVTAGLCLTAVAFIGIAAGMVWLALPYRFLRRAVVRFSPSIVRDRTLRLIESVHWYRKAGLTFVKALVLSLLLQLAIAGYYSLTGIALGVWVSPLDFLLFLPIVTIITFLPVSFGGLGVRELAMVYLFGSIGVIRENIIAISLCSYVLNLTLSLIGGGLIIINNYRDWEPNLKLASDRRHCR